MEVVKELPNGARAIKCGFCAGSGTLPPAANAEELFDEDCSVCGGSGFLIESTDLNLLVDCKRCSGEGKKYDGAYFMGDTCNVCKGKGYIDLSANLQWNIWDMVHPKVVIAARKLFESRNYTEALFRGIKELNTEMKKYYQTHSGEELDGHALVGKLLSLDNPVLHVADTDTETGKNMQKGLMQMMQGLFVGVRNPIAHDQTIGRDYCVHVLFLLSFIHHQLDYTEMRKTDADDE